MIKIDQLLGEILELSLIGRATNLPEDVPFDAIVKDGLNQETERLKFRGFGVPRANDLPMVRVDKIEDRGGAGESPGRQHEVYVDQARPKIEIGHRKDKEETIFFVRDNRVGIDPSQHGNVFGLFYRLDPNSKGTGVGLTIVKHIIELHGERIWIESELGKGCPVCFTLLLLMLDRACRR